MPFLNPEAMNRVMSTRSFWQKDVPKKVTVSAKELKTGQSGKEYYMFTVRAMNGDEKNVVDWKLLDLIAANNDFIDENTVFEAVPRDTGKKYSYTDKKTGEVREAVDYEFEWRLCDAVADQFGAVKKPSNAGVVDVSDIPF